MAFKMKYHKGKGFPFLGKALRGAAKHVGSVLGIGGKRPHNEEIRGDGTGMNVNMGFPGRLDMLKEKLQNYRSSKGFEGGFMGGGFGTGFFKKRKY